MRFEPENGGAAQDYTVFDFKGAGVAMGMYNTEVRCVREWYGLQGVGKTLERHVSAD